MPSPSSLFTSCYFVEEEDWQLAPAKAAEAVLSVNTNIESRTWQYSGDGRRIFFTFYETGANLNLIDGPLAGG